MTPSEHHFSHDFKKIYSVTLDTQLKMHLCILNDSIPNVCVMACDTIVTWNKPLTASLIVNTQRLSIQFRLPF